MKLLSVETSCDETAIAVLECEGDEQSATFKVLSHALLTQIELHREFGGVFPALAKREHAKNLVPLLQSALEEAELLREDTQSLSDEIRTRIGELLKREADMAEAFIEFVSETERPDLDAIAVTYGPGLEPALWVGVNFAQALAIAWSIPLVPVNHMEGHVMVALAQSKDKDENMLMIENVAFPVLALLISGGHTEFDVIGQWLSYNLLGQTRDDAVGEAFDKVGRMLGLPYPGGPEISKLAARDREDTSENTIVLPRPMIDSPNFDFSFSGLKTAVLYLLKAMKPDTELDSREKEQVARAFEDAAADVLVAKTAKALKETSAQTLVIGGGVSANSHFQQRFKELIEHDFLYVDLRFPPQGLTGDNAVMIGIAGFYRAQAKQYAKPDSIIANGNLSLSKA